MTADRAMFQAVMPVARTCAGAGKLARWPAVTPPRIHPGRIEQGDAQADEFATGLVDILHGSGEDDPRALAARRDRTRCAKVRARRHVREVDHDVAKLEHDGRTELVLLLPQHLQAKDLLVEGLRLPQVLGEDGNDVHFPQRKAHAWNDITNHPKLIAASDSAVSLPMSLPARPGPGGDPYLPDRRRPAGLT